MQRKLRNRVDENEWWSSSIPFNYKRVDRYVSYCEDDSKKRGAMAASEHAKQNNGILDSDYFSYNGTARMYAKGPSIAKIDRFSRTEAVRGSGFYDADQAKSAPNIVKHLGEIVRMTDSSLDTIQWYLNDPNYVIEEICFGCDVKKEQAKKLINSVIYGGDPAG